MNEVRIGVGFGPGTLGFPAGPDLIRFAEIAEELGFAHYWVNDHLSWMHPLVDPVVLLSAVAARTSRIGLGTGVYLLPLRPPAAIARAFASTDYLSGGRTILGIGVGGEFDEDFQAAGIPAARRGARTDATIRILRQLWRGEPVSCHDEFFDFDGVQVLPTPVRGDIPIIVGGRSEAALRRAATLGDGWMPYLVSPERVAEGVAVLREYPSGLDKRVIAHVFAYFGDDPVAAREEAIAYLSSQYRRDMTRTVDKCVPCGPPEEVAARLARYVEAGVTDIVLRPLSKPDRLLQSLVEDGGAVLTSWRAIV